MPLKNNRIRLDAVLMPNALHSPSSNKQGKILYSTGSINPGNLLPRCFIVGSAHLQFAGWYVTDVNSYFFCISYHSSNVSGISLMFILVPISCQTLKIAYIAFVNIKFHVEQEADLRSLLGYPIFSIPSCWSIEWALLQTRPACTSSHRWKYYTFHAVHSAGWWMLRVSRTACRYPSPRCEGCYAFHFGYEDMRQWFLTGWVQYPQHDEDIDPGILV